MSSLDEAVAQATKRDGGSIPALILKGVDKNGNEIISKVAGYTSLSDDAAPLQPDAVFKIASCTKFITSVAMLQCVERGQIDLDDSVYKILPELADSQIISSTDGEHKKLQFSKPNGPITVRHLLTHSSGISYEALHPILTAWRASRGEALKTTDATVPETFTIPLLFEPGQGWQYGGGLDWAGYIVRRLNGNCSLEEYLIENVWKPLGRPEPYPTFDLNTQPEMKARLLGATERRKDGGVKESFAPLAEGPADQCGGHGLALTVSDFVAVLGDLVAEKPKLLKPETVTAMFSPQFLPGTPALQGLKESKMHYQPMAGPTPEEAVNHGLGGLLVTEDIPSIGVPRYTLTWGGMTNMWWMANRYRGVAGMYASQMLPPGDPKSIELMQTFFAELWKRGEAGGK